MSLSETQEEDVSQETVASGKVKKSPKQSVDVRMSGAPNGDAGKDTVGSGNAKKSLKPPVNTGLSEAQNGDISQETVGNVKVKKSPKKSTVLTNGEAAVHSPNSQSKKKKKKKKRNMVDDAGPGGFFIFFDLKRFKLFSVSYHSSCIIDMQEPRYSLVSRNYPTSSRQHWGDLHFNFSQNIFHACTFPSSLE